ncbi:hypothetical protein ACA626_16240, partial [Lactiplantibacillus pentosus]
MNELRTCLKSNIFGMIVQKRWLVMNYPSNISRQQFELIRPDLEAARRSTRPRKYDLYELFCAV